MTTTTHSHAAQRLTYRTIDSPVGSLTLAGAGITLTRLVIQGQRHQPDRTSWHADNHAFPEAVDQIRAYFDGELTRFDVEMHLAGTDFQRRVWDVVQLIPYGQTSSYAHIAEQIGVPGASRAVGVAVGRNPIPIIVGCHRVIGASGGLTGYVGGIDCKRSLLAREVAAQAFGITYSGSMRRDSRVVPLDSCGVSQSSGGDGCRPALTDR